MLICRQGLTSKNVSRKERRVLDATCFKDDVTHDWSMERIGSTLSLAPVPSQYYVAAQVPLILRGNQCVL